MLRELADIFRRLVCICCYSIGNQSVKTVIDPTCTVYLLYVDDVHLADLSAPEFQDMFWCSYVLTPTSDEAIAVLRDEKTWEHVNFTIKDKHGKFPNTNTFPGGYNSFCNGETDRLTFRSLFPPR